jgi:hypothetical protein
LVWNKSVIAERNAYSRDLLESRLEADLALKLHTDETVTMNTTVRGPAGVLAKLRGYFIDNHRLMNRPDFTIREQARGERPNTLWEREKAKQQVGLHLVESDEDSHVDGDGTKPAPAVHGEEVAIKTVMASMVRKGNLEEAQHVKPRVDKAKERVIEIQLPPPAMHSTNPGDLEDVKGKRVLDSKPPEIAPVFVACSHLSGTMAHYSWIFPVHLRHVAAITQRIESLTPLWRKERGMEGEPKEGWTSWTDYKKT